MKDQQVIIRVPEPCHEDWNKMDPDEKGRFCASCATSVVDFSKMSDDELKYFLIEHKGKKTCGHFKRTQLNKPITITVDLQQMPRQMNATYKFVMVLFIVFGTFLFSCTDQNGKKVKEIQIENDDEKNYVMGMMVMPPPPELVADTIDKNEIPPLVMIGYEEGEMMGAVAYEYEIDDDTLTGDVVMVEEPSINPIDSCSFDGVEMVGFSPPLIKNDSIIESPLVLGGLYVEDYFEKDNVNDSIENKITSISDQNLKLVTNWKVFPNPSNGLSTIQYYLQRQATVRLDVFDISGKHMKTLVNQANQHTGIYHIPFDGSNLPNGVYIVSLIINGESSTEKLVVEK